MFEAEQAENLSNKIDQLLNGKTINIEQDSKEDTQLLNLAVKLLSSPPFNLTAEQDRRLTARLSELSSKANPQQAKRIHATHQTKLAFQVLAVFVFLAIFTFGLFCMFREIAPQPEVQVPYPAAAATATPQTTETANTTLEPITPLKTAVVSDACTINAADIFDEQHLSFQDMPQALVGGGNVESGDFQLDIWLGCDDEFNNNSNYGANTFSEIEGLGIVSMYTYNGVAMEGTLWDYAGFAPFVRQSSGTTPVAISMGSFVVRGIQFSNEIIPDFSKQDTPLRYIYFAELPDGRRFGAVLAFTLQRELEGYRPVDISVSTLSAKELENIENQDQADLPFATRNPIENFPILNSIKTKLESWQNSLTNPPGWLYIKTTIEDYSGNTLYGGLNNYIDESWYDLDENGRSIRYITQISTTDGRVLQQSVYANDLGRNLTFNTTFKNSPTKLNLIQDLITFLNTQARSSEDIDPPILDWQGRTAWMFVSGDTFDEPVNMDKNRLVSAIESRKYVDTQTGERLGEETFIYTPEGGEELHGRNINASYERVDSPPQQVLALLEQENGTYSPPVAQGTPPPEGFDPSSQPLKLLSYPGDDFELPSFWVGDIYAGDYLLGRVNFGGIPGGRCQRSQDGSLIAYINETQSNNEPYFSRVAWLNLSDINTVYQPLEALSVRSMSASWSPQKPEFVLTACLQNNTQCGIYLVDTEENTTRLLSTAAVSIWPIVWKPDGSQISLIDTSDEQYRLLVIDEVSGNTIYEGDFDAENWQVPVNSPVADWGITFPRNSDEETGCFK